MKKGLFVLLATTILLMLLLMTGCSEEVKFESIPEDVSGFHEIDAAEEADGGVVYFIGNELFYDKDGVVVKVADHADSLWREGSTLYYTSDDVLYSYDLRAAETVKIVENPHNILGKYDGNIISYSGRSIYSINGNKKKRIFKDGYYVNRAALYKNKVYGIPASNVYEYDLDTLEVKKMTKGVELSRLQQIGGELYVENHKEKAGRRTVIYSKITDEGMQEEFSFGGIDSIAGVKAVKGGMFMTVVKRSDDDVKGNKLIYFENGKTRTVDKDHSYNIAGIINNELLYYKNEYSYGTYGENLTEFYLYNGKGSRKAFDLDVGSFEWISGYEYDGGILLEISYESVTSLYKYDGEKVEPIDTPDSFFYVTDLDIVDGKAYVKYIDGEETAEVLGAVIDLE